MSAADERTTDWFHGYVGACLAEHDERRRVPPVDDDGDFVVTWSGSPIYLTVIDEPVLGVRAWAVAATGLPNRVGLLRELNELNSGLSFANMVLTSYGSVIVSSTLVAEAVGSATLPHAVAAVGACAEHVGVLLAGAHDGAHAFAVDAESA